MVGRVDDKHRAAFEAFAERVEQFDTVQSVVLFGSVARGDHGVNSDVDILIRVESLEEREDIEAAAYAVTAEYGVSVTPVIVEEGEETSFTDGVEQEGVTHVRS